VVARETDAGWQADWQFRLGEAATGGQARGDSQAALADAVMLAVSRFLAPRYLTSASAETITLEILGADVERFAETERLLEPLGARLLRMGSDRLVYRLEASPEQLRAQLALARLREVPIEPQAPIEAMSDLPQTADEPAGLPEEAPPPAPQPASGLLLRYSW